jgi:hypothetical protein
MLRNNFLKLYLIFFLGFLANSAHAIVNGKPVSDEKFDADYGWAVYTNLSMVQGCIEGTMEQIAEEQSDDAS